MEILKWIVETVKNCWHKRASTEGFLILSLVIAVFSGALAYFISDAFSVGNLNGVENLIAIFLVAFSTLLLALFFCWLYWRTIPIVHADAGIVFALHSEVECRDLVEKLYKQFISELRTHNLHQEIVAKLLPITSKVHNAAEASDIIKQTGARVLVHGVFSKGNSKGEAAEGFSSVSFTINQALISPEDAQSLSSSFTIEDFFTHQKNSFWNESFVSKNLSNCACAFLGMCLTANGKYEKARRIWTTLFRNNCESAFAISPKAAFFRQFISRWFCKNEFDLALEYYNRNLLPNLTSREVDHHADFCRGIVNSLFSIEAGRKKPVLWKNSKAAHLLLFDAILDFHAGVSKSARQKVELAKKLTPKDASNPLFSLAFLALWQQKFGVALKHFRQLQGKTINPGVVLNIIEFYQAVARKHPSRPEFKFGLAIINEKFCDIETAVSDYKSFVEQTEGLQLYGALRSYAQERVAEISAQPGNELQNIEPFEPETEKEAA